MLGRRSAMMVMAGALAALSTLSGALSARPDAPGKGEVVLYYSADEPIARLVIDAFEKKTGVKVRGVGDTEATKAVGLAQRIRAEKGAPKCDVFWNSEAFLTIALANEGILEPHVTDTTKEWPAALRDEGHTWHGFAQRARVMVYNTNHPANIGSEVTARPPQTMRDLWHPNLGKGVFVMARPFAGTMRGHAAALVALWGEEGARAWAMQMAQQKVRLLSGNAPVVQAVALGEAVAGLTDSDDVWAGKRNGWPVEMIYLRNDKINIRAETEQKHGPLLIPNTAARIKGGPNPDNAALLVEFLLSADVERMLAKSDSKNIPTRPEVAAEFPELAVPDAATIGLEDIARCVDQAMSIFGEAFPE